MVREKIRVSTRTLQWKCVESRTDSKRLYYGRLGIPNHPLSFAQSLRQFVSKPLPMSRRLILQRARGQSLCAPPTKRKK